jgi:hypothetical protein
VHNFLWWISGAGIDVACGIGINDIANVQPHPIKLNKSIYATISLF